MAELLAKGSNPFFIGRKSAELKLKGGYAAKSSTPTRDCHPLSPRSTLLKMAGIRSETRGDLLFITGSTYEVREQLKGIGAKWNPAEKAWTVAAGTDISPVTAAYEAIQAKWRAEGARWRTATSRRRFHGRCCEKAVCFTEEGRFDGPLHYKCEVHGVTWNNYTGD